MGGALAAILGGGAGAAGAGGAAAGAGGAGAGLGSAIGGFGSGGAAAASGLVGSGATAAPAGFSGAFQSALLGQQTAGGGGAAQLVGSYLGSSARADARRSGFEPGMAFMQPFSQQQPSPREFRLDAMNQYLLGRSALDRRRR